MIDLYCQYCGEDIESSKHFDTCEKYIDFMKKRKEFIGEMMINWPIKKTFENFPIEYSQEWQNGKDVGWNQAIDACIKAYKKAIADATFDSDEKEPTP